ncbi:hypothetical protein HDU87_000243 [Geranomyces variabilis]|uniref:UBZ4-type domain-containing protein n=1 Tax=Geranomyces variabilis TaxID=109894 RepID=A0AAD5TSB4_9FUNG|nr:hypothetical protein HDU87_000243 [Geranomyces variabilis]
MAAFQSVRRTVAHLKPNDLKALTVFIDEEKDVLKAGEKFGKEKVEAGKYLANWGKTEEKDLEDVASKFATLYEAFGKFQSTLVERHTVYRSKLKAMRQKEEDLIALRKRVHQLQDKLADAIKRQKPSETIKVELTVVERDLAAMEAQHEAGKRALFREAMHGQMDAWMDFGTRVTIMGQFGKHLADQILEGALPSGQEYTGIRTTRQILMDFSKELRTLDAAVAGATPATASDRRDASATSLVLNDPPDVYELQPPQHQPPPHPRHSLPSVPSPYVSVSGSPITEEPTQGPSYEYTPPHAGDGQSHAGVGLSPGVATMNRYYQKPLASERPVSIPHYDPTRPISLHEALLPRVPSISSSPSSPTSSSLPRPTLLSQDIGEDPSMRARSLPRENAPRRTSSSGTDRHKLPAPPPSFSARCPVCDRAVSAILINEHLDSQCALYLADDGETPPALPPHAEAPISAAR